MRRVRGGKGGDGSRVVVKQGRRKESYLRKQERDQVMTDHVLHSFLSRSIGTR